MLDALSRCPSDAETVLLVGHNPGLEELVQHLVGDDLEPPGDGKLMPTATLVRLEMPGDWRRLDQGCAQLISITRPKGL